MKLMVLFFVAAMGLMARDPMRVAWERAPEVFAGKVVAVQLSSGARVKGQWVSAASGDIQNCRRETSDARQALKGFIHTRRVPRSVFGSVNGASVEESREWYWESWLHMRLSLDWGRRLEESTRL